MIEQKQERDEFVKTIEALNAKWNAIMESTTTFNELPIKPESNSRDHDHAMAMEVKIVHEEQSEQIKKESSEK